MQMLTVIPIKIENRRTVPEKSGKETEELEI